MKDFLQVIQNLKNKNKVYFKKHVESKKEIFSVSLLLFPLFLLVALLLILRNTNAGIQKSSKALSLHPLPAFAPRVSSYPVLRSVLGEASYAFSSSRSILDDISAQSVIIVDADSQAVLYAKNKDFRFSLASTTKIMTALVALEYFKKSDVLEIKNDEVNGVIVGFQKGEKLFFEDLLYAMLLPSGNDAALAIAQNYPLGEKAFIEKMNDKARELHLYNTHFSDSSGLADREDYSTVLDLARLCSYAIQHPLLSQIVATKQKSISSVDGKNEYHLTNLNKLLSLSGVNGIKTGYTDEAGEVLTTSYKQEGHNFIIVVMKSEDRFLDTQKLLSFLKNSVGYLDFSKGIPTE